MRDDTGQAIARQWAMLRTIPRAPAKAVAADIAAKLRDQGFRTSRRTVERDLQALSGRFPLVVDDRSKPYGWSWMKHAGIELTPALTPSQSVALLMADRHLKNLLPRVMHRELAPLFLAAERELASTGWTDWHKRTAISSHALTLLPPAINASVLASIQLAFSQRRCLDGRYRAKGATTERAVKIHPLGLLQRDAVLYLVCTMYDFADVRQLAIHRLTDVVVSSDARHEPDGFDFAAYVQSAGARAYSARPIKLVALFTEAAAEHLKETPQSADQTWTPVPASQQVRIRATVADTDQLRWWLLGFGSQVEVVAPRALRSEFACELTDALSRYNGKVG